MSQDSSFKGITQEMADAANLYAHYSSQNRTLAGDIERRTKELEGVKTEQIRWAKSRDEAKGEVERLQGEIHGLNQTLRELRDTDKKTLSRERIAFEEEKKALSAKEQELTARERSLQETEAGIEERSRRVSVGEVELKNMQEQHKIAHLDLADARYQLSAQKETLHQNLLKHMTEKSDHAKAVDELKKRESALAGERERFTKEQTQLSKDVSQNQLVLNQIQNERQEQHRFLTDLQVFSKIGRELEIMIIQNSKEPEKIQARIEAAFPALTHVDQFDPKDPL